MRSIWWSPRALRLHLTLAIVVPGFLALGDWQLHRALGGNGLSWAYTIEWPLFAGYAVFLWWKLVHEDDPRARSKPRRTSRSQDPTREEAELEAYNEYLASLHKADKRSTNAAP